MSKITTADCKAFLEAYDSPFLQKARQYTWMQTKDWFRVSKFKDDQGRVAREFASKKCPVIVTLAEGANGLEVTRERGVGRWEPQWNETFDDWIRNRSIPDPDQWEDKVLYPSLLPSDYEFGVCQGDDAMGLVATYFFQPINGEGWDQHIPVIQIAANAGHTIDSNTAGELMECTWEFPGAPDDVKAELIAMGFSYNAKLNDLTGSGEDEDDDEEDDDQYEDALIAYRPNQINFGIIPDDAVEADGWSFFFQPQDKPSFDGHMPVTAIASNVWRRRELDVLDPYEGSECTWSFTGDVEMIKALLIDIGFVYDPALNVVHGTGRELYREPQAAPPKPKWTQVIDVPTEPAMILHYEDSGQSAIIECDNSTAEGGDGCFFVRLQSWDDKGAVPRGEVKPAAGSHQFLQSLLGKKVRITVEVIE